MWQILFLFWSFDEIDRDWLKQKQRFADLVGNFSYSRADLKPVDQFNY